MTYRGYFFTNMYLSPIQCGIQTAHCVADMFTGYADNEGLPHLVSRQKILHQWALMDKTIIVLNGGYQSNLELVQDHFQNNDNPYPHGSFHEGYDALNCALTCVGIILPESIYGSPYRDLFKTIVDLEKATYDLLSTPLSRWELKTAIILNEYRLA